MDIRTSILPNLEAISTKAAAIVGETAAEAVRERGEFLLVLSGGSTPRRLYALLGTDWRDRIPWRQTHLFWADERFVPADDPENNYGVAKRLFIERVAIPAENVHPIDTSVRDHRAAAEVYEKSLRTRFGAAPAFDLALLGMGADGHTASLFPEQPLETPRWTDAVLAPVYRPPRERVTLTLKALNGSKRALFLVSGSDKREAMELIRSGRKDLPAARIQPREELIWLVTEEVGVGE